MEIATDGVFTAHPQLVDHRGEFPWLTGSLGDPFSPVWFVAENPSLTQVRRVIGVTPEYQWSQSEGDRLFREQLVKHHFKEGDPSIPGGWRCYITNIIKSAAVAKDWNVTKADGKRLTLGAWAPVFKYELAHGAPRVLVFLGAAAGKHVTDLGRGGLIGTLPSTLRIEHYSYIAFRPDHRGRPRMHPDRIAEWSDRFGEIARRWGSA
jgi:hypothetical protein